MKLLRLYIAQHGQSATTIVSEEHSKEILAAIVGGVPFMLSATEKTPNGGTARTSAIVLAPLRGGLTFSISPGNPIPLDERRVPIPIVDGQPTKKPVSWDNPRDQVVSVFERLPWSTS